MIQVSSCTKQFGWLIMMILFCFVCSDIVHAQSFKLKIILTDSNSVDNIALEESNHLDQLAANSYLNNLKALYYAKGYLACSVDSVVADSFSLSAYLHQGPLMSWVNLRQGTLPDEWRQEMNLNFNNFPETPLNPVAYKKLVNRILTFAENHGYPFAEIKLDSFKFHADNGISAALNFNYRRYFEMDTLSVSGDAKVSKKFLYSYLGFQPGDPYDESLVRKMLDRLRKLPFIQPSLQRKIYFQGNKVMIVLELKERKTDQVDGIVGFAPSSADQTQLLITGEANIDLKNIFRRGIAYNLHWKSFQERSQQLRMGGVFPYLLQSPVGVDANFEYVKYDTLFFTLQTSLGVRYLFDGTNYVKFYVQNQSSAIIKIDTSLIRNSRRIPNTNPVDSRSYGSEILLQKLDFVNNPRKGIRLNVNVNIGTRKILKDIRIEEVVFYNSEQKPYSVYDSIKLKSVQGSIAYDAQWFLPLKNKSTLVTGLAGRHLVAENIFFNDLYRFGGTRSLRGFNEESLLANSYTMVSLEFRYLFSESSYFQVFANGAKTTKILDGITTKDTPIGFGTGVSLEVKSGLLTLAYAVGREKGNPIQFSNARVHFGIINYL